MSGQPDDDQDDARAYVNGVYVEFSEKGPDDLLEHIRAVRTSLNAVSEDDQTQANVASLLERYFDGRLSISIAMHMATAGAQREMPPSTFLFDLLMKPDEAKDATANLEDYYPIWVAKHGYWWGRIMTQVERVVKTVSVFIRPGGN